MDARREFIHLIVATSMDEESARKALEAFDRVSLHYNMTPTETALATYDPTSEPILNYYIESRKLDGLRDSTLRQRKSQLRKFLNFANVPIAKITSYHCRGYMAMVAERKGNKGLKITDGTYNNTLTMLSAFCNWCVNEGFITKNPMACIHRKKEVKEVKKSISEYELELMRKNCKNPQERLLIEVAVGTGCRVSEIANMKVEDFDFRNGKVLVFGKKTNEFRETITNAKMEVAFDDFISGRANKSPYIFASEWRPEAVNPNSTRALENMFTKIVRRAGIKRRITLHDMRRTFATFQLNSGTSVMEVKTLLGHKRLDTTQVYYDIATINFNEARKHIA